MSDVLVVVVAAVVVVVVVVVVAVAVSFGNVYALNKTLFFF